MAVLGVQLVISMVMASCLSKLSPHFSFARWILCSRLVRYLHPTDEELRTIAKIPPPSKNKGKKYIDQHKQEPFTIPKSTNVQLEGAKVTHNDILPLHFYMDYQWLIDFAVSAIIVYLLTEFYYAALAPKAEFNLSMLWCSLVCGFAIKVLFSLTAIYFRTDEGGERMLCVVFGFFFTVVAMGVLIINEDTLEFGLEKGYFNFSRGAKEFLKTQGMGSHGPASLITFRIILTIISGLLGAFLTFPGLRLARMHSDSLKYAEGRPFLQLLLNLNIIAPLLITLLWVKPVVRDLLVRPDYGGHRLLLNADTFELIRVAIIWGFCLLRFSLVWTHLQGHLNIACEKMQNLQKEAGRISSIELQKMVAHIFYYLCVVALQYLTPIILLLFFSFMLKTLAEFSVTDVTGITWLPLKNITAASNTTIPPIIGEELGNTAVQFQIALASIRQVFTPQLFKGVFSFLSWWICAVWFTTSAFGMVYYSYFVTM